MAVQKKVISNLHQSLEFFLLCRNRYGVQSFQSDLLSLSAKTEGMIPTRASFASVIFRSLIKCEIWREINIVLFVKPYLLCVVLPDDDDRRTRMPPPYSGIPRGMAGDSMNAGTVGVPEELSARLRVLKPWWDRPTFLQGHGTTPGHLEIWWVGVQMKDRTHIKVQWFPEPYNNKSIIIRVNGKTTARRSRMKEEKKPARHTANESPVIAYMLCHVNQYFKNQLRCV